MKKVIIAVIGFLIASCEGVQMGHIDVAPKFFPKNDIPVEVMEMSMEAVTIHYETWRDMNKYNGDLRSWVPCSIIGNDIHMFNNLAPEDEAGCLDHELTHFLEETEYLSTNSSLADMHPTDNWKIRRHAFPRTVRGPNGSVKAPPLYSDTHWKPYGYDAMVTAKYAKYLSDNHSCGSDKPDSMQVRNGEVIFNC